MRLQLPATLCAALLALAASHAARAGAAPDPAPDAVLGTLPFQSWPEPSRVVIDLAPPGKDKLVMMLDTGAASSIITPRMARDMNISVRRTKSSPYRKATLLGRDLQFYVDTQLTDTASKTGWEYGLLGGDFLDDYVVEIDFPGRQVRFLDAKKYQVPESVDAPDESVLAFKLAGTRIAVPVEVDGKTVEVGLDTGCPDTMVLSGAAAKQIGIDVAALAEFGQGQTVLGPMDLRFHEAATMRFAGVSLSPFPMFVAPKGWYNLAMGNDSVIGYDSLAPFVLRIDYPRKRLWLKRTAELKPRFLGGSYVDAKEAGAFLVQQGDALYVMSVVPGSAAARYGLATRDVIVPPQGEKLPKLADVLARIKERKELTVARQRGDVYVDLVLPAEAAPEGQ